MVAWVEDPINQRVRCHWHLRKKMWSVSYYSHLKRGWRVVRDSNGEQVLYTKVVLKDVTFKVNEGGRQRTLREKRKNVHAWMEGKLLDASVAETYANVPCGVPVKYNPYKWEQFYTDFFNAAIPTSVYSADFAAAGTENGVLVPEWALGLEAA